MLDGTSRLKTYRFDQMARQINDRVDNPAESGVERYVGLEHLDADSLRIRRWGEITDVESTKLRFQPGDVIFGKRRVYTRKLVVPISRVSVQRMLWCSGRGRKWSCPISCRSLCKATASWTEHLKSPWVPCRLQSTRRHLLPKSSRSRR